MAENKNFDVEGYNRLLDETLVAEGSIDNVRVTSIELRDEIENLSQEFDKALVSSADDGIQSDEEFHNELRAAIYKAGEELNTINDSSKLTHSVLVELYHSLHEAANLLLENDENEKLRGIALLKNIDKEKLVAAKEKIDPSLDESVEYLQNLKRRCQDAVETLQRSGNRLYRVFVELFDSFDEKKIISLKNSILIVNAIMLSIDILLDETQREIVK